MQNTNNSNNTDNKNNNVKQRSVKVIDKRFWARKNISQDLVGTDVEPLDSKALYPTYVCELESKVSNLEKQLLDLSSAYKSLKNDQQAYQQRMQKLKESELNELKFRLFNSFIQIIDDIERAISAAKSSNNSSELLKGIELIYSRMLQLIKSENIELIAFEKDDRFDPKFCNAIGYESTNDSTKDLTIAEVLLNGYKLNDRIIRPANVKIYKYISDADECKNLFN